MEGPLKVEIKLLELLEHHGLNRRGVVKTIAEELEIHRHTVRKIFNKKSHNPSLEIIGQLCDWLIDHGVPAQSLPRALFGSGVGVNDLWEDLAAPDMVTIYLGEYVQTVENATLNWISRWDASVQSDLVRILSTPEICGDSKTKLETKYLRFYVGENSKGRNGASVMKVAHAYREEAVKMYAQMRGALNRSSAVLVGSQKINMLVELFVAECFGCKPFVSPSSAMKVPFFATYHNDHRASESCFGGLSNPPGIDGKTIKGIHYLTNKGKWAHIEWIEKKQDAGIVITSRESGTKGCTLAILGLSGKASEALGREVTSNGRQFWPPYAPKRGGGKIGAYICRINYRTKTTEVVARKMDEAILARYVQG